MSILIVLQKAVQFVMAILNLPVIGVPLYVYILANLLVMAVLALLRRGD